MMPNNKDENSSTGSANRIAVIAVHGVSDQQPFDSAKQVANLLINPNKFNISDKYSRFVERFIKIPVKPIEIENQDRDKPPLIPDERGAFIDNRIKNNNSTENKVDVDVDIALTKDYLSEYDNDKSTVYDTVRLEGEYNDGESQKKVHIYEMYWADLSRLGTGFIRIFGELYQLLFHLSSIGRQLIDLARISIKENQELNRLNEEKEKELGSRLICWGRFQLWTGRILSLILPALNLLLLIAVTMSVPIKLIAEQPAIFLSATNGIIISLIISILLGFFALNLNHKKYIRRLNFDFKFWTPLIILFFLFSLSLLGSIAIKLSWFKNIFLLLDSYKLLTIEWYLILFTILFVVIVIPYNKRRPGIFEFIIPSGVISFLLAIILLWFQPNNLTGVTIASLRLVEITYSLISLAWIGFVLFYFATYGLGKTIQSSLKNIQNKQGLNIKKTKELFDKAFRTSIISLIIPAILFLLVTLGFWSAFNSVGSRWIPNIDYDLIIFKGLKSSIESATGCDSQSDCFLQILSDYSASPFAIVIIGICLITLAVAIWTLLPSIISELSPPKTEDEKSNYASEDMGTWLSKGYGATIKFIGILTFIVPCIFLLGVFISILLFFFPDSLNSVPNQKFSIIIHHLLTITKSLQFFLALAISASAGSLIAFGSRLNQISLGLRSVLDAVLDVDNYLRLYPTDDNPRARIYARYLSLLKYICDRPKEDQYDAIIIIAHSQGTVITADLLRYLKQYESSLKSDFEKYCRYFKLYQESCDDSYVAEIPNIYLFTMGSPIRQLYSFAFPHLYHWVYNPNNITEHTETTPNLPENINPDPTKLLNVKQWVNAYRSGDYIGRYLWRSPDDESLWDKADLDSNSDVSESKDRGHGHTRREFCIGAGGHTHYWDETAPDIAYELDRLIREADLD
ncbi:MAG: hypothetical protein AAGE84_11075 [Cyanobacteria bacterium P01_G01_bin.39]